MSKDQKKVKMKIIPFQNWYVCLQSLSLQDNRLRLQDGIHRTGKVRSLEQSA